MRDAPDPLVCRFQDTSLEARRCPSEWRRIAVLAVAPGFAMNELFSLLEQRQRVLGELHHAAALIERDLTSQDARAAAD